MAFQQHYVDLMNVLQPHVEDVAFSAYPATLISSDLKAVIINSSNMPSKRKVSKLLKHILELIITKKEEPLLLFVDVLKEQQSMLVLMGNRLESTYSKCNTCLLFLDTNCLSSDWV